MGHAIIFPFIELSNSRGIDAVFDAPKLKWWFAVWLGRALYTVLNFLYNVYLYYGYRGIVKNENKLEYCKPI